MKARSKPKKKENNLERLIKEGKNPVNKIWLNII